MQKFNEFKKIKEIQITFEDCEAGNHKWGPWLSCPQGLGRECLKCKKAQTGKLYKGKFIINPPLDKYGFLDEEKLNGL